MLSQPNIILLLANILSSKHSDKIKQWKNTAADFNQAETSFWFCSDELLPYFWLCSVVCITDLLTWPLTSPERRSRRRRGSTPSSTGWSAPSSAEERSPRRWRRRDASSSCRCARWGSSDQVQTKYRFKSQQQLDVKLQICSLNKAKWVIGSSSLVSLCSISSKWTRSKRRKASTSCRTSSSISTLSASTYLCGETVI